MKFIFKEKFWNWTFTLVATGIAGLTYYSQQNAEKFQRPLTQREAMIASYQNSASLEEKLGRKEQAAKLREECLEYEADWRSGQKLSALISPLIQSSINDISPEKKDEVRSILTRLQNSNALASISKKQLGDAWLVAGDYQASANIYKAVAADSPAEPLPYAAQARAKAYLLQVTDNADTKQELINDINAEWAKAKTLSQTSGQPVPFLNDPVLLQAISGDK